MSAPGEFRVLISGSRDWDDERVIETVVSGLQAQAVSRSETLIIIHGAARGADSLAGIVARRLGVQVIEFPAHWQELGKKAGPLRNIQMLKEGKPELVIGFNDDLANSKGTRHMVSISAKAGLDTYVVSRYAGDQPKKEEA